MFSVHYIKRPGATLEAGTAIAKLELDDPSKVHLVRVCLSCRELYLFNAFK